MAFQLIFGQSAVPGSWQVCERLLSLNTPHDIDILRQKIRDEVYDEVVPPADQQKIRQLESERDSAISSGNSDRAYDLCFEIANLAKTFTKENLETAVSLRNGLAQHQEMNFVLAYIFYIHYDYHSDRIPDFDFYFGIRKFWFGNGQDFPIFSQNLPVMQLKELIRKFLDIADDTSLMERLVRTIDLSAFIASIKEVTPEFLSFVDRIELNPTLVSLFRSPIKLATMSLLGRYLLSALVDIFNNIQRYDGVAFQLWKKKWFVKFVTNYAKIFKSYEALAFLMAIGEGWNFNCHLRFLAWPPFTEPSLINSPFKFNNSLPWLWNAAVVPVLFDKKTLKPSSSLFYFPFLILGRKEIKDITDLENLPVMVDLSIFLAMAAYAEWRHFSLLNETVDDLKVDGRTYTSMELLSSVMALPISMTSRMMDLNLNLFNRFSIFCHLFWHLKFHAENHTALFLPLAIEHFQAVRVSLSLLLGSASSPWDLGQLVLSAKEFRRMLFDIAVRGLPIGVRHFTQFMVGIMAVLCSALPNIFLRELLFSVENYGLHRVLFTWELAQHRSGPRLIGCMLRSADTALRRRWTVDFQSQLCSIASSYFLLFFNSEFCIGEGIDILLAIHGTYRPRPIASLMAILNEVDSVTKRGLAVKLFISKLLPSKAHSFLRAKSELPTEKFEAFRSTGVLVAGIVLASLVTELEGTALLGNVMSKEKESRRTLIREMKRQLELFCA